MRPLPLATLVFFLFSTLLAAESTISRLPLVFQENRGQADHDIRFIVKGDGFSLALAGNETRLRLSRNGNNAAIRSHLVGANAQPRIYGEVPLDGVVHHLRGGNTDSITGIPTFAEVRYQRVYPGIDVLYYGKDFEVEYDFVVASGGNPKSIVMQFDGIDGLKLDEDGNLVLSIGNSDIVQRRPEAYQGKGATRSRVTAGYRIIDTRKVAFDVGSYDPARTLIIDPVLTYSTFLGGSDGDDDGRSIATDAAGNVYVAGTTTSTNFQTAAAFQGTSGSSDPDLALNDAFVTKLNASGTAFIYSTYLGGSDNDEATSLAVDASGNVVVGGVTNSPLDFPTSSNAFRRTCSSGTGGGCEDGFVARLNASGNALLYSTYLGGNGDDEVRAVAVDTSGNAYVAGTTSSTNFPTVAPLSVQSSAGSFVAKLTAAGSLVYSTYFGAGAGATEIRGLAVDTGGSAYVTGSTPASTITATDVFVAKLNAAGNAVIYTSYIRGGRDESGNDVAVDAAGNAYVTGQTGSIDFLTTPGVFQPAFGGGPIFRSVDAGATWSAGRIGLSRTAFYALAIAPASPAVLYAAASDESAGGVFKSVDSGNTWEAANSGLGDTRVHALAIAASVPDTIFAGTRSTGVFKSINQGVSWSATSLNTGLVTSIVVDPSDANTVYAATDGNGAYRTTNGGTTWDAINNGLASAAIRSLVMHPNTPSMLWAATSGGIYRTTNGGASWTPASSGLFDSNINALVVDPRTPGVLYAATNSFGVFRSTNGGLFWLPANGGLTGSGSGLVTALAIDANSGTLYSAVGEANVSRVFKSTNGTAWTPAGLSSARITSLAVDRNDSSRVFAATVGGSDAFVARWNASGILTYSTYLGGYRDDSGNGIVVNSSGNAYVVGNTSSTNFPLSGAMQSVFGGGSDTVTDAFVVKLNSTGAGMAYGSYLGGGSNDYGKDIALDSSGNAYITGQTASSEFPTASALIPARPGLLDAFVARINDTSTASYSFPSRGGYSIASQGTDTALSEGYVRIVPAPGSSAVDGLAIFGFRQNDILISEAAVPASRPIISGRIYAEAGGALNTGIAIVNPNNQDVTLSFYFTDQSGNNFGTGSTVIRANSHIAAFLNDAPFNGGSAIQGTFTFTATAGVVVIALRGHLNSRSEFLMTTLPVADLSIAATSEQVLFSHFADGAGWKTEFALVNTTDELMSGRLQFFSPGTSTSPGRPVEVILEGGAATSFAYTIPARSSRRLQTSGSLPALQAGSVRMIPDGGSRVPSAVGIFSFWNGDVTVTEAGVPALPTATAFKLYAELSGNFGASAIGSTQTGVAIANSTPVPATVNFELTTLAGDATGLTGSVTVPANGQVATFLSDIVGIAGFASRPALFQGVLRATTSAPGISMIGLRGRYNERGDFLIATTAPSIEGAAAPSGDLFFPHFADGGGYTTQFIVLSVAGEQAGEGSLRFFSENGDAFSLAIR